MNLKMIKAGCVSFVLCVVAAFLAPSAADAQSDPEIAFTGPTSVTEGDGGFVDVVISWQLAYSPEMQVSFEYELPADTDTPADWDASPHTPVLVPAGTTSGSFTVRVVGDLLVEATESMDVFIWNITGARTNGSETAKSGPSASEIWC